MVPQVNARTCTVIEARTKCRRRAVRANTVFKACTEYHRRAVRANTVLKACTEYRRRAVRANTATESYTKYHRRAVRANTVLKACTKYHRRAVRANTVFKACTEYRRQAVRANTATEAHTKYHRRAYEQTPLPKRTQNAAGKRKNMHRTDSSTKCPGLYINEHRTYERTEDISAQIKNRREVQMEIKLTGKGKKALLGALSGKSISFTKIELGSGAAQNPKTAVSLMNPVMTLEISSFTLEEDYCVLTSKFKNSALTAPFRITEAGFYIEDPDNTGGELLYALGQAGEAEADYVPDKTKRIVEMQFDAMIFVGDAANITAQINSSLVYASAEELSSHTEDKNNPHAVTKEQVGLGSVPNVATNDQTPTYTDLSGITPLSSGEKLSAAMAKLKAAVAGLISHIGNRNNPHGVTAAQAGAASAYHTHAASEINSGVLTAARGGTGCTSLPAGGLLVGGGTGAVTTLEGEGALYKAADAASPEYGVLPSAMGGTGVTTDKALSEKLLVCGVYTGDGSSGREISLGFRPRAVYVSYYNGMVTHDGEFYGGLAVDGHNVALAIGFDTAWESSISVLGITENGFMVNYNENSGIRSNTSGLKYSYIAVR